MKTLTLLFISALVGLAQSTANLPALTVSAEATAALNATLSGTFSGVTVSLTAPVLAGDTSINVVSTAGIGALSAVAIEGDAMKINSKTATSFAVTRNYYGTTAASHTVTAQVNELKFPTMNRAFIQAIADFVGGQMDLANSTTVAAQNAVITSAQAAKVAAKANAVQ